MCWAPSRTSSGVLQLLLGVDQRRQHLVEVGDGRVAVPDRQGQRFQPLLAGRRGQGALLRLVGQVEVFEPLGVVGREDGGAQLVGQLALASMLLRMVCLRSASCRSRPTRSWIDAQHLLVQAAGPFLAVAGDERDGVALVEQLHHRLDLHLADLQDPGRCGRGPGGRVPRARRCGLKFNALRHHCGRHCAVSPCRALPPCMSVSLEVGTRKLVLSCLL